MGQPMNNIIMFKLMSKKRTYAEFRQHVEEQPIQQPISDFPTKVERRNAAGQRCTEPVRRPMYHRKEPELLEGFYELSSHIDC